MWIILLYNGLWQRLKCQMVQNVLHHANLGQAVIVDQYHSTKSPVISRARCSYWLEVEDETHHKAWMAPLKHSGEQSWMAQQPLCWQVLSANEKTTCGFMSHWLACQVLADPEQQGHNNMPHLPCSTTYAANTSENTPRTADNRACYQQGVISIKHTLWQRFGPICSMHHEMYNSKNCQ